MTDGTNIDSFAHLTDDPASTSRAIAAQLLDEYETDPLIRFGNHVALEIVGCLSLHPDRAFDAAASLAGLDPDKAKVALGAYIGWLQAVVNPVQGERRQVAGMVRA